MRQHLVVRQEVEPVPGRHQRHAEGQFALSVQAVIGPGQIAGATRFRVAGDAAGIVDGQRRADQFDKGLRGRIARAVSRHAAGHVHDVSHQHHGVAVQDAVRLAGEGVAHDLAFLRVRRILRDPGQLQRSGIRHAAAEHPVEHHRMIRRSLVQFFFRKASVFPELRFDIAAAGDPFALRRDGSSLRQFFLQHVETVDAEQHDTPERLPRLPEMAVAVVDAGHGAAPF